MLLDIDKLKYDYDFHSLKSMKIFTIINYIILGLLYNKLKRNINANLLIKLPNNKKNLLIAILI